MQQVPKKERTKNFTEAEKMLLIELVQENCKILENKTTNSVSVKEKEECWEELRLKFMSRSNGVVRTVQSLKTCWENIKKRTKKQYAEEKQAVYKTGGGPYKTISDPIAEQVQEMIRPAVEGLSNIFDNDCIAECDNKFDRDDKFVEEWLDTAIKDIVGYENNREEDKDKENKEGNEFGKKDDDKSDMEEDALNFRQKDKVSWRNWNPQKLQTQISIPLRTSMNKKSSPVSMDQSVSSQNKRKKNDLVLSTFKGTVEENNQLKKKTNNNKLDKFSIIADSKINLISLMMGNGKEKHELEIEILKMQLQVQVECMQKELQLKTLTLDREKRNLKNM